MEGGDTDVEDGGSSWRSLSASTPIVVLPIIASDDVFLNGLESGPRLTVLVGANVTGRLCTPIPVALIRLNGFPLIGDPVEEELEADRPRVEKACEPESRRDSRIWSMPDRSSGFAFGAGEEGSWTEGGVGAVTEGSREMTRDLAGAAGSLSMRRMSQTLLRRSEAWTNRNGRTKVNFDPFPRFDSTRS